MSPSTAPLERAAINRANSQHSTGPPHRSRETAFVAQRAPSRLDRPHRRPAYGRSRRLRPALPRILRRISARHANRKSSGPGTRRYLLASPPHPAPRSEPPHHRQSPLAVRGDHPLTFHARAAWRSPLPPVPKDAPSTPRTPGRTARAGTPGIQRSRRTNARTV